MRYNRKACLRALELAEYRFDMTVLPFGLAFQYRDQQYSVRVGVRLKESLDDSSSVAFTIHGRKEWSNPHATFQSCYTLEPGLKPRSLKKHELRKQARDLRRMKQYD